MQPDRPDNHNDNSCNYTVYTTPLNWGHPRGDQSSDVGITLLSSRGVTPLTGVQSYKGSQKKRCIVDNLLLSWIVLACCVHPTSWRALVCKSIHLNHLGSWFPALDRSEGKHCTYRAIRVITAKIPASPSGMIKELLNWREGWATWPHRSLQVLRFDDLEASNPEAAALSAES